MLVIGHDQRRRRSRDRGLLIIVAAALVGVASGSCGDRRPPIGHEAVARERTDTPTLTSPAGPQCAVVGRARCEFDRRAASERPRGTSVNARRAVGSVGRLVGRQATVDDRPCDGPAGATLRRDADRRRAAAQHPSRSASAGRLRACCYGGHRADHLTGADPARPRAGVTAKSSADTRSCSSAWPRQVGQRLHALGHQLLVLGDELAAELGLTAIQLAHVGARVRRLQPGHAVRAAQLDHAPRRTPWPRSAAAGGSSTRSAGTWSSRPRWRTY